MEQKYKDWNLFRCICKPLTIDRIIFNITGLCEGYDQSISMRKYIVVLQISYHGKQILSEFCCKIECHKPFSTLNYECSHAVTNNTSIIPAQTKYYYYQIFPVAVRWIFGCWWKFITYDGFIYSHKKKSCGGNFTKPSRNATHSSSKWQMHVFHSD